MAPRVISLLLVPATLFVWLRPVCVNAGTLAQPEAADADPDTEADPIPEAELAAAESAVDEAQQLFIDGANKFDTADYAGAIELWTQAYALVPNLPEYAAIKARLIANLAAAQERAYAIDSEVSHLKQAKILLESYRGSIDVIYPNGVERERERAWVADRLGKIDVELQAVADREAAARANEPEPKRPRKPGQALVISGSVLTGLGVAGLSMMVAGMVVGGQNNDIADIPSNDLDARLSRFSQGRLGNALAIAGGVGGAVLVGAGVALLVVGVKKKRAAGSESPAGITLVPVLDPSQMGVGVVGRF
jgi:hypothetical protein